MRSRRTVKRVKKVMMVEIKEEDYYYYLLFMQILFKEFSRFGSRRTRFGK